MKKFESLLARRKMASRIRYALDNIPSAAFVCIWNAYCDTPKDAGAKIEGIWSVEADFGEVGGGFFSGYSHLEILKGFQTGVNAETNCSPADPTHSWYSYDSRGEIATANNPRCLVASDELNRLAYFLAYNFDDIDALCNGEFRREDIETLTEYVNAKH